MYIRNFAGDRNKFIGLDGALKNALAKGFALYSPDELTYFRVGDHNEINYFEYLISTALLAHYRLFASYNKLNPLEEAAFQVLLALTNITYEFLKIAQELLRIPLICIKGAFKLLTLDINAVYVSVLELITVPFKLIYQTARAIPACALFAASLIGTLTRYVFDISFSKNENMVTKKKSTDEIAKEICNNIQCDDENRIKCRVEELMAKGSFFDYGKTSLEKVVDAPTKFLAEADKLIQSKYLVNNENEMDGGIWDFNLEDVVYSFTCLR